MNFPVARSERLVVQELPDEILVCDTETHRAFCLNKTAAEIWKHCNGKTDIQGIARSVSKTLGANVNEEVVWLALDQLSEENLLEKSLVSNNKLAGLSRREVIRRVGLTSMVALPVIASLVMPTAAQAQSDVCATATARPDTCACTTAAQCDSACCLGNTCTPSVALGCPCTGNGDCDSGCCRNNVCSPGLSCRN